MRNVPDSPLSPWQPPSYSVDADGKVVGAVPGKPNNWGRWGDDDQRGTANLLTAEGARDAAALVRRGEVFSLALPIGHGAPNVGTRSEPLHLVRRATADQVVGDTDHLNIESSDDLVVLALQASTQLDGHGHFAYEHTFYNGYWSGLMTAGQGARRLGIHNQAGGVVGRGVLLDAARHTELDPFTGVIDAAMLDSVAAAQGVEIRSGDIVLVRTGWLGTWLSDPETRRRRRQAGLALDTIDWLASHDVAMVAADNKTVEAVPGPEGKPILSWHIGALRDLGLLVGELFDLDALADDCAADGVYEFLFSAAPLPIVNAVGSPLNPLVVK